MIENLPDPEQLTIRLARPEDSQSILDIYAPYVSDTTLTFVSTIPSVQEIATKMRQTRNAIHI